MGKVTQPANINISRQGSQVEITRRWFDDRTVGMTVFTVVWLAGTSYLAWSWHARRMVTRSVWPIDEGYFVLPYVIFAVFIVAGLLMAYSRMAEWLNRTHISVNRWTLSVRHGPLPWPGNLELAVADIRELHIRRALVSEGRGRFARFKHEIRTTMADGKSRKLAGGFASHDDAGRVCEVIEQFLGLRKADRVRNDGFERRVVAALLGLIGIAGTLCLLAIAGASNNAATIYFFTVVLGAISILLMYLAIFGKSSGNP